MKWVLLTTAPDQLVAEMWRVLLLKEDVAALLDAGDVVSYLGVSANPVRILVRESQIEAARTVLGTQLGEEPEDGG